MFTRRAAISALLAAPLLASTAAAQASLVFAEDGWAIRGTDPVAYFRGKGVIAGSRSQVVKWRGAMWSFETAANREAFELNPHAFAPQYGGHCALALAKGFLAPSDPYAWTIRNDRLFLNFSMQERGSWLADADDNIRKADANWSNLLRS